MDDLEAYEHRFRRAGLPLLIEGWSAREDALPRAFPLLAVVLCGELLGALNLDWSPWANVGALAAALALLLGAVALSNRVGGRPVTALPRDLGPLELGLFVVLPAILPLVFGGQVTSALVTWPPKTSGSSDGSTPNTPSSTGPRSRGSAVTGRAPRRLDTATAPSSSASAPARAPTLASGDHSRFSAPSSSPQSTTASSGNARGSASSRADQPSMSSGSPARRKRSS